MELINETPYPSLLFRGCLEGDKMLGSVGIKITYDIVNGQMQVAAKPHWPIYEEPTETPYGRFESDKIWKRGSTDLFTLGKARALKNIPVKRMNVSISVDKKINNTLLITGDRVWQRKINGLVPSEPLPFTEINLCNANAYGGHALWDQLQIPHGTNPAGKGFIWEETEATGQPLPNIEHPAHRITKWSDRVPVMGVTPILYCERRVMKNMKPNGKNQLPVIDPTIFNTAFDEMITKQLLPGEIIKIEGMTTQGPYMVTIPAHEINLHIQLGDDVFQKQPRIEQVGIEVDENRAFIMYRYSFRYTMVPRQQRQITIKEK